MYEFVYVCGCVWACHSLTQQILQANTIELAELGEPRLSVTHLRVSRCFLKIFC